MRQQPEPQSISRRKTHYSVRKSPWLRRKSLTSASARSMSLTKKMPKNRSANNSHGDVDVEAADADARLELVDAAAAAARLELVDAAAAAVADRLPLAADCASRSLTRNFLC